MRVLLAEDDLDQLELRSQVLVKVGYEISAAADAETALKIAAEKPADIAVVDLKLPTEEAGLALIRGLKKLDSRIRVIVLTGSDPKRLERLPEYKYLEAVFTKGNASRRLIEHLKETSQVGETSQSKRIRFRTT